MPRIDYKKYIRSSKWRAVRFRALRRANGLCEKCSLTYPTEVHHKSYLNLGNEQDNELMAVCRPCHIKLEYDSGNIDFYIKEKATTTVKKKPTKLKKRKKVESTKNKWAGMEKDARIKLAGWRKRYDKKA